eukprot:COSAG01_NODE_1117_length_11634_cov_26.813611_3_plen_96_part_00
MQQPAASQPESCWIWLLTYTFSTKMDSALDLCAKKPAPLDRQSRAASDRAQPEHQSSKTEFAMAEKVLLRILQGIITQNYRTVGIPTGYGSMPAE